MQVTAGKQGRSLSDDLNRVIASKAGGNAAISGAEQEEEDVPLWSTLNEANGRSFESTVAHSENTPESDPQIKRILQIIPGTLVENPK